MRRTWASGRMRTSISNVERQEVAVPIYEYKCDDCGKISELLVLKKDEAVGCTSCNSQNLEKLMSAHNTVGTVGSGNNFAVNIPDGCYGSPNCCDNPGSCCLN